MQESLHTNTKIWFQIDKRHGGFSVSAARCHLDLVSVSQAEGVLRVWVRDNSEACFLPHILNLQDSEKGVEQHALNFLQPLSLSNANVSSFLWLHISLPWNYILLWETCIPSSSSHSGLHGTHVHHRKVDHTPLTRSSPAKPPLKPKRSRD